MPPVNINIMLESNPLKSIMLVRRLAVLSVRETSAKLITDETLSSARASFATNQFEAPEASLTRASMTGNQKVVEAFRQRAPSGDLSLARELATAGSGSAAGPVAV